MQRHVVGWLAVGAVSLASACASEPPPAARAVGVERMQCVGTGQEAEQLVKSTNVLHVEPLYSHVRSSNNNSEERVNGAKLLVRPPKGVSAERMTRALQCHNARILLGKVQGESIADDPYWLPDAWVNIDVTPENGNFAVTISADSVRDNLQVFKRANRYGEQQMATQPELP
jgi:hypothetical protein